MRSILDDIQCRTHFRNQSSHKDNFGSVHKDNVEGIWKGKGGTWHKNQHKQDDIREVDGCIATMWTQRDFLQWWPAASHLN